MKTPREILSERHRAVDGRLDALRREVVAEHVLGPRLAVKPRAVAGAGFSHVALTLWRELVLPCRRIWLGLGAAWLVIVAAHLAISGVGNSGNMAAARPAPS